MLLSDYNRHVKGLVLSWSVAAARRSVGPVRGQPSARLTVSRPTGADTVLSIGTGHGMVGQAERARPVAVSE